MKILTLFLLITFALACGGGGSSAGLANGDGISGTGEIQLAKVDLASPSYGSGSNLDFSLNTLAPILMVQFAQAFEGDPNEKLRTTLTHLQSQLTLTVGPDQHQLDNLIFLPGADQKTYYIHLRKSSQLDQSSTELQPGQHYRYEIEAIDGSPFLYEGAPSSSLTGYFRVKPLTVTYLGDFTRGESLVKLNEQLKGVGSLEPEFLVHTSLDLSGATLDLGPLSLIDIRLGGSSLLKADPVWMEVLQLRNNAIHFRVKNAPLTWGGKYRFSLNLSQQAKGGEAFSLSAEEIPDQLELELQNQLPQ